MATKRAKVNKTLEKAKKLVSKKGKNKTKKGTWPEGQAKPQSKAYDIENDKTVPAKRTGYRFTKEGAKKLGKQPNDRPTAEEIEKYRNQTFKVKGKVNKSGPKGVGDGSFRYLYIESRADKSDLNKARKLELGGYNPDEMLELKIFVDVYEDDYEQGEGKNVNSYEVNWLKDPQVLAKDVVKYLSEELYLSENPNDYAIDDDGNIHTDQLQDDDGIHVNDKATLERWKKGEEKLYNAHYYIRPLAVKNRRPSVDELSQATGIGTYAKGGSIKVGDNVRVLEGIHGDFDSPKYRNKTFKVISVREGGKYIDTDLPETFTKNQIEVVKNKMAKGGVVFDPKEVRQFEKYVFSYYGKNGIFADEMEEGVPATTAEVLKAVSQYLAYSSSPKKSLNFEWAGGDTIDRECVKHIIDYNRNPKADVKYHPLIKDMKKTPILEYGGILQPMIGGVNADPRFDIYNTTMFAEKGAEVPKKKPKFEEGIKSAVKDYFHSKEIDDPTFWKDRDGEYNIEEMVEMAKDKFNSSEYILERYAQEYADSKYAKGGATDKGYSKKEAVIDYYLNNDIYDDPETYGVSEEDLKEANKKNDFSKLEKAIIKYHGLNDPSNVKERFEVLGLDDEYAKGGKTKSKKFEYQVMFYDGEENLIDSEYYVDDPSDKEVTELAIKIRAKTGQLYRDKYDSGEYMELVADYDFTDMYAKGGMTSIYEIGVRKKGKPGMFVVSIRAKDEEAALKEFHRQNSLLPGAENFKVVGVYKTARRRLEDGGEMAKGGRTKKGWSIAEDYSGVGGTKNPSYYLYNQDTGETKGRSARLTKKEATEKMKKLGYMAHGGSTHEQGYDDREDERLAMRHGKIASKDFVGSHKRREHSRRDDARFETRNK